MTRLPGVMEMTSRMSTGWFMNNTNNNGEQADLGRKTRKAMEDARKSMQQAKALGEKHRQEKARFKAAKKALKQAKKAAKAASKKAKRAQEELRNLLKKSDPKRIAKASGVAKVSRRKGQKPKATSKEHVFPDRTAKALPSS